MGGKFLGCLIALLVLGAQCCGTLAAAQSNESYEKGAELVAKRSYKDAIPYFDKAIESDAKHSEAYLDRALCNYHLGNYQKVVDDCKEVLGHAGAHVVSKRQAYLLSAGAENAVGQYADALKSCDQAVALAPHASLCFSERAFAYQQLKKFDEALRDCNEAIKLDPKHASNYEMRAAIYETLARQDRQKYKNLLQERKPGEKPWEVAGEKTAGGEKK